MRGRFPHSRFGVLSALVAVVLSLTLVAGCSPVGPGEAARARQAAGGPTGQMSFQLPERPTAFDPFAAPGTSDQLLAAAHFEPLVSSVEGRIVPRMADWWAMTDDGRRLALKVKRDRWSDDVRMGASDLLFTVEAHLRPGSRSPLVPALLQIDGAREFHEGRAAHVSGIVAETSQSVVINLTERDVQYLNKLTGLFVLPRHIYETRDVTRPETFREPRVGSGAYLFDSWQGPDQVTLLPNRQVKPFTRLSAVVARTVSPGDVVPAMTENRLDVGVEVPGRDIDRVPDSHSVVQAPGDRMVGLSGARGPLADPRVRQALAYAIDREGILEEHLGGHGRVVDSALFAPDWATSPQRAHYSHDPERARALLAEAGWNPNGELRLVALSSDLDRARWDAVVADLADAGVRATVEVRPVRDREAVWADATVNGVIETFVMPVPEPSLIEPWVTCGTESGYCNAELDRMLRQGRSELVATDRQEAYHAVDALLSRELPVIPLWVPDASVAVVDGRGGVSALLQPATAMIDFWGPA